MTIRTSVLKSCGLLIVALVVGCEKEQPSAAAPETLPATLLVATEPAGAVDVVAAKQSAKDAQAIVIKGRVAGQKEPLAQNRAIMTLADATLQTCERIPGDTCPTPWDACCEPADVIAARTISVQVVGADGKPIKAGLAGLGGIAPLKDVVVSGTARAMSDSSTMVIEAKQVYVRP